MASCVFGAGANELAEASIVASTKVRMTAAATMLVTATGQQDSDGDRAAGLWWQHENSDQTPGTFSQPRTTAEGNQREKDAQRKTTVSAENTLRCTRA